MRSYAARALTIFASCAKVVYRCEVADLLSPSAPPAHFLVKTIMQDASYDDYMRVAMSRNLAQSWASRYTEMNLLPRSESRLAFLPVSVIQFHQRVKPRFGLLEPFLSEEQITGARSGEAVETLDAFTR